MKKPTSVTLDLKFLRAQWDTTDAEGIVLRKFLNEFTTRRAFQHSRGFALEEPVQFLNSVTEFRTNMRGFVNELPVQSTDARLAMLSAIELAGEILDAWHLALKEIAPNTWEFAKLEQRQMMEVMASAWPVIEAVRKLLAQLADRVEAQL